MMDEAAVRIERRDQIAVVVIDNPPVNALSTRVRAGLLEAFTQLAADRSVAAIVLTGRNGVFVAGADLREMGAPPEPPFLPDVVAAMDALPQPILAAIDGAALGGGLELALACDGRLGSANASVGLTETRLGIIPGAGGTQRLARLVGIESALRLVGEGRVLKASEARGAGILDEVLTNEPVADAILTARQAPKRLLSKLPVPIGDPMAEESTARRVLAKAKGVPAVAEAVRIIRAARTMSFEDAVAAERAAFLELRGSDEAAALRHVFFAEREAVRVPGLEGIAARPIRRVGVIGAGTMGAAIASALADVGLAVDLVERDEASAEEGKQRVSLLYVIMVL
jgi:3-hydroxyacyl-CoA dehydrogenase